MAVRSLLTAVMFLTRIPVRSGTHDAPDALVRSLVWWPWVGAAIGATAGGVFWGASLVWNPWVAAFLALAVSPILTGCFHEDGFADVCDGFGGYTPERRREILKDSRIGSFAGVGLVLLFGAMASALAAVPPEVGFWSLVAAHAWGRWTGAFVPAVFRKVAEGASLSKPLASGVGWSTVMVAGAGAAVASLPMGWAAALAGLGVAVAVSLALGRFFATWLGGVTGDGLGATNIVVQLGALLVLPLVGSGWAW